MNQQQLILSRNILFFSSLFFSCVLISYVLTGLDITYVAGAVVGIGLFIFGFLNPKIALYLLIFSMLLSPEFGSRDYTGKGFTIRFEDLLLVIMCFTWFAKSAINKEVGLAKKTRLNLPIFFYVLTCFIATMLGIIDNHVDSPLTGTLFVVKYIQYFVIYFLIVNNIRTKAEIRNLLTAVLITYLIVLISSLAQIPGGGRITTPFEGEDGEPNTLGGYLIMMFSLNVVLFFNVPRTSHRIFLGMTAFLNFVALLHSLSRSAWIGFIAIYFSLIYFSKKRNILIFGMVVGLLVAPMMLPKIVIERIMYTFGIASEEITARHEFIDEKMTQYQKLSSEQKAMAAGKLGMEGMGGFGPDVDSSTGARLDSMKQVFADLPKRPVFGYGVTGYEFLDAQFPRVLIESGIVGLLTFCYLMWLTGKLLYTTWKEYRTDPLYATLSAGTFCAFIGLLAHSLGTNTFIVVRLMEPFWCLVGLNAAIPFVEKGDAALKHLSDKGTFSI